MELLTNSRLTAFRECPRKHRYAYTLGMRSVRQAGPLRFGTMMHDGPIFAYWMARQNGDANPGELAMAALPAEWDDPFELARAEAMTAAYVAVWNSEAVEVLAVEQKFTLPLLNPATGRATPRFLLGGKIDLLFRLADGRVAIVEHKTTSRDPSPGGEYRSALALDSQISQYFWGAEALGYAPDLCLYDVLVKPAQRPLEATPVEDRIYTKPTAKNPVSRLHAKQRERDETPEEYSERVFAAVSTDPTAYVVRIEVPRLEGERAEYQADVWDLAAEIRLSERSGRARRNPGACWNNHAPCPFLPVCQGRASIDDPTLYQHTGPHPELRETENAA